MGMATGGKGAPLTLLVTAAHQGREGLLSLVVDDRGAGLRTVLMLGVLELLDS